MEGGTMYCALDGKMAARACTRCGRLLCETCVGVQELNGQRVEQCPVCHGLALPLEDEGPRDISDRNFWYYMATALFWPLSLRGLVVEVLNALFVALLVLGASFLAMSLPGMVLSLIHI